ncbi:uncharacterized protein PAC_15588 [Phialocephala subalpina]|uniref:Uncharacterized protein n=1 Tax=Phialocephala subalpina TaxID=576137 RepID=A0A1L7XKZ1_9HELO|nr:uncharacterized protein PAC_15588 [Phialocephala subalpina]
MANQIDTCHLEDPGDPDVAGLGVTVSFLANVFLTAVAILLAFSTSGPRSSIAAHHPRHNSIDRAFVRFVTRRDPDVQEQNPRKDARHEAINAALWKLLETLSDQQLITGTALTVSVYIRLADSANYSVYSFQMAMATIFLSCLTHMCTLVALGDSFREEGKGWSLVAMIVLLILMAPILLISNFPSFIIDPALSVRCAFSRFSKYGATTNTVFGMQSAMIIYLIVGGYTRLMMDVFFRSRRPPRQDEDDRGLVKRVPGRIREKLSRAKYQQNCDRRPIITSILRGERLYTTKGIWYLVDELRASYLWELIWLAFYYNFGITSVVVTWDTLSPLSQWSLSFGQLVPITMLVFGLVPIYSEYRDNIKKFMRNQKRAARADSGEVEQILPNQDSPHLRGERSPDKHADTIEHAPFGHTASVFQGEGVGPCTSDPPTDSKQGPSKTISEQPEALSREQRSGVDLYHAIIKHHPILPRVVIISIGLLSFAIFQILASILGGAFNSLIIRSPAVWTIISIISRPVAASPFLVYILQCMCDSRKGGKMLKWDEEEEERKRERRYLEDRQWQEKDVVSMAEGWRQVLE